MNLVDRVRTFLSRKEDGASLAEYGLLVALIAVVYRRHYPARGKHRRHVQHACGRDLTPDERSRRRRSLDRQLPQEVAS